MSGYLSGLLSGGSSQAGTTAPQIQAAGAASAAPAAAPAAPVGGLGQFGQGFVQGLQGVGGNFGGGLPWQNNLGQALGGLVGARQPMLQGLAQQFGPSMSSAGGFTQPPPLGASPQFPQFSLLRGFPQLQGMLQNYNGFY